MMTNDYADWLAYAEALSIEAGRLETRYFRRSHARRKATVP